MLTLRRLMTGNMLHGLTAAMVVLLLFFCTSSAVPALAGDHGCQGSDSSARICGQSAFSDPLPIVVHQTTLVEGKREIAPQSVVLFTSLPVSPFHADPSAPRAPPSLV